MQSPFKKLVSLALLTLLLSVSAVPAVFAEAVECDKDGDGYISLPMAGVEVILGNTFKPDGNYSALEWDNFFTTFKKDISSGSLCSALNFKKGIEPLRCDNPIIDPNSGVYDPGKASSVAGSSVYPNAFDNPDNGIDENCEGSDGKLIEGTDTGKLGSLKDRIIYYLRDAVIVISVIILIWGGVLYSTAAGDERKTAKARKAIIGALIGLAVGLLAPAVVSFITASLG